MGNVRRHETIDKVKTSGKEKIDGRPIMGEKWKTAGGCRGEDVSVRFRQTSQEHELIQLEAYVGLNSCCSILVINKDASFPSKEMQVGD